MDEIADEDGGWNNTLQKPYNMREHMTEILTFGELCEAIRDGKDIQIFDKEDKVWREALYRKSDSIECVGRTCTITKYRIKPAEVFKYQWVIKEHGMYFLTTHKETAEDARYHYGDMIVEPYLPSKEPVND